MVNHLQVTPSRGTASQGSQIVQNKKKLVTGYNDGGSTWGEEGPKVVNVQVFQKKTLKGEQWEREQMTIFDVSGNIKRSEVTSG